MKLRFKDHPHLYKASLLLLDEEEWKVVYNKFVKGFVSKLKNCYSLEDFNKKFTQVEYSRGKNYALWLLEQKGGTRNSLKDQLKSRYFSDETIETILANCVEMGYLNDEAWAFSFIRVQQQKRYGTKVIAQKLRLKGIEPSLIERLLEEESSFSEREQVIALLETKYRLRSLQEPKELAKTIAAIVRRGYDVYLVMELVKEKAELKKTEGCA